MDRSRRDSLTLRDGKLVKTREVRQQTETADAPSTLLLRTAAREAGLFQRSVLGHLDHHDWLNRVRNDGQRLTDLLRDMGFIPSDDRRTQ
jgi:hypothetical protein